MASQLQGGKKRNRTITQIWSPTNWNLIFTVYFLRFFAIG
jgi:hypothetical protein